MPLQEQGTIQSSRSLAILPLLGFLLFHVFLLKYLMIYQYFELSSLSKSVLKFRVVC